MQMTEPVALNPFDNLYYITTSHNIESLFVQNIPDEIFTPSIIARTSSNKGSFTDFKHGGQKTLITEAKSLPSPEDQFNGPK